MNSTVKTIMFWVFILICLLMLWTVVSKSTSMGKEQDIPYSELYQDVQAGQGAGRDDPGHRICTGI